MQPANALRITPEIRHSHYPDLSTDTIKKLCEIKLPRVSCHRWGLTWATGLFASVLNPDAISLLTECANQDRFPEVRLSPGTGGLLSVAERKTSGFLRLAVCAWLHWSG